MHRHPPPNLHGILLPVIACLPTAFFSPQPPPALLPLLSPILRQRMSLLSSVPTQANDPSRSTSNWLNLLTWSPERASRLIEIVSNLNLEPHPVSGELELFEDEEARIEYRRLDKETTQARCIVHKLELAVLWTWCTNDSGGVGVEALAGSSSDGAGLEDGWRVAEVRPTEGVDEPEEEAWYATQGEADAAADRIAFRDSFATVKLVPTTATPITTTTAAAPRAPSVASDDDDYWASYDRTPASRTPLPRTPAASSGLAPLTSTSNTSTTADRAAENEYFARYEEVQPAMDDHDPEEAEGTEQFESTLGRGTRPAQPPTPPDDGNGNALDKSETLRQGHIHSPQPSRPHSPSASTLPVPSTHDPAGAAQVVESDSVARLESAASASTAAEVGVKQHISTELKSLYRLARAAGIERSEFERVVQREIEVLGMME